MPNKRIPATELLRDLGEVTLRVGEDERPVTMETYREHGTYSVGPFTARWEKWPRVRDMVAEQIAQGVAPDDLVDEYNVDAQKMTRRTDLDPRTAGSEYLQWLREHPRTTSEIIEKYGQGRRSSAPARQLIAKLKPVYSSSTKVSYPHGETVVYVYGDERRALQTFIETNLEYVEKCFSHETSVIDHQWEAIDVQMLREEYAFMDASGELDAIRAKREEGEGEGEDEAETDGAATTEDPTRGRIGESAVTASTDPEEN